MRLFTIFSCVRPLRRLQGQEKQPSVNHQLQKESEKDDHYVSLLNQITTNLEEVVFEEVPHGLVSGNVPPGVEVEVQDVEPGDEDEGGELGLVADGDQHHEERAHQVLDDLHCRHLEAEEREEHEDQEDPARKLQVHFRLVLSQTWHLRYRKL